MASATLTGTVKLNTTAFQRSLRGIKTAIGNFHKSVAQPIGEAAGNMAKLVTKASMLGAIVAGFGVKKAFELGGMEESFTMLFRDSEKARKHVKDITDLSAATPFDLAPFMEASRLLHVMGGDALSNKAFMTQMGDAAAMARQPIEQVAEWVGRMHASIAAGSGTGRGGYMLMQTGIIKPEELIRMQDMVAAGDDLSKIWPIMEAAMARAKGSMDRFAKGGHGLWSTLKDLTEISLAETFKELGDVVKSAMVVLTEKINALRDSGAFEVWGKQIAATAHDVINAVWRVSQTWQNLNENTRAQLLDILKVSGVFIVAWRTGLLGAMIKALTYAVPLILSNIGLIAAGVAAVGVAVAGFAMGMSLGQYLEDKFNLSTAVVKLGNWLAVLAKIWLDGWKLMFDIGKVAWESLMKVFRGEDIGPADVINAMFEKSLEKVKNARKYAEEAIAQNKLLDEQAKTDEANRTGKDKDFLDYFHPDRIKENMQDVIGGIKDSLKGLIPPGLDDILSSWEKASGVKFPEMEKLKDLTAGTAAAAANMQTMARQAMPLRGFFANLSGLTMPLKSPSAAVAGAKQTDTPTKAGQEKQNQLLQRQVELQEEMVRVSASGSAAWA